MSTISRRIKIRIRRPVDITLAFVPSRQAGDPPRRIALDRHNMVYCTCKGWRYNGHACTHLTDFRRALASAAEQLR